VAPDKAAQSLGDREGEHEMVSGQLPFHLSFEPLPALAMLAGGTMAIPAGAENKMSPSAVLTLKVGVARIMGAALHDGVDGLFVFLRHVAAEAVEVLGTEGAEDLT
jgi:hypothetical protein